MANSEIDNAASRDSAITILTEEHRTLGRVAHLLQRVVGEAISGHIEIDHALIARMLYYIDIFPERCHHPKEEEFLFRRLRARTADANAVLDELQAQHVRSAQMMARLQQLYVRYLGGAPDGLRHFFEAADSYSRLMFDHMELEEKQLLPLAGVFLLPADWQAIDEGFRADRDPLGAGNTQHEFLKLRQIIFNMLPRKLKRGSHA